VAGEIHAYALITMRGAARHTTARHPFDTTMKRLTASEPFRYLLHLLVAANVLLGGCATYRPKPLPHGGDLVPAVDRLESAAPSPDVPHAKRLSLAEVAHLAVRNNPDLRAARKRLGVERARLYAARLPADPELSANVDLPTGTIPGTVTGWGIGLAYDLTSLIGRGARIDSEEQGLQQADLEFLWQEWQVSQQARYLTVRLVAERRQLALLRKMHELYLQRYRRSRKALAEANLTLDVTGTDLTALLDTLSKINQLVKSHNETVHSLKLLLGMDPEAPLQVHLPPLPSLPDAQTLRGKMKGLAQRRPDLLALQAGYRSQEARVRAAILGQFPSITIGITRARDTGSVSTNGFTIGLTLPLFSGNRGEIKVERATRARLREEYHARLDQAAIDVDRLIQLQAIVAEQRQRLDRYLPSLNKLVARGREAYRRGDIDALTFLNMETSLMTTLQEKIGLDQSQWDGLIATQTVLALSAEGKVAQPNALQGDPQ